jgi:hypothetical protein
MQISNKIQHIESANLSARIVKVGPHMVSLDVSDPKTAGQQHQAYLDMDRWTATHLRDGLSEALGEVPDASERVRQMGSRMVQAALSLCRWAHPKDSPDPRDYPEGSLIRDVYENGIRLGGTDWTHNRNTFGKG